MPNLNLGQILEFVPKIITLVASIRSLFGHGKTGEEKKALAMEAVLRGEDILEGVTGTDLVNSPALQALASESIELGVTILHAKDRLLAIAHEIHDLRVKRDQPKD